MVHTGSKADSEAQLYQAMSKKRLGEIEMRIMQRMLLDGIRRVANKLQMVNGPLLGKSMRGMIEGIIHII